MVLNKRLLAMAFIAPLLFIEQLALAQTSLAVQLTEDNIDILPAGGIDAIGGIGDWLLSNGELCAVISAKHHQAYMSPYGGALVDLWHCQLANDQWVVMHDQHNLRKEKIAPIISITAATETDRATITVITSLDGIESITEYALNGEARSTLLIKTRLQRKGEGDALNSLGTMVLHPRGALQPFTLDTVNGEYSIGFAQPAVDTSQIREVIASAKSADLQVLVGSQHMANGIAYGLHTRAAVHIDGKGQRQPLKTYLMASETFSMLGLFAEPFYSFSRNPGMLAFLRGQFMDLAMDEAIELDRAIIVAPGPEVAAITDRVYQGTILSAQLDTSAAAIEVQSLQGVPLSFTRADQQGRFKLRLPVDVEAVKLKIITPWSTSYRQIDDVRQAVPVIETGGFATLSLPEGQPMALIFKGIDGSDDPILFDELTGITVGGIDLRTGAENNRIALSGSAQDIRQLRLPVGNYQVIASRGIEFDIKKQTLSLAAGGHYSLAIAAPQRAVDSDGWVAADFHVHSGVSMDSSLLPERRVAEFVANGGEVLVTTEHNITYDIEPVVQALGLSDQLSTITGVELSGLARSARTPTTIGHSNIFPVQSNTAAFLGGTRPFEGKRLGEVIADYKQAFPDSVFQLNHPRANAYDDDIAFFNHLSIGKAFDPALPLTNQANNSLLQTFADAGGYRDIDFDILELLNGEVHDEYLLNKEDWFSLLRQGFYKVATANSDSHSSAQLVALPRTYVWVGNDDIASLDKGTLMASLKAGHAYGTNGPLLDISFNGTVPGASHSGDRGELYIKVQAADWININRVTVYINGESYAVLPVDSSRQPIQLSLDLVFESDSFISVEVNGTASEDYSAVAPGFIPLAFSNPVFVDVAGDGYRYGQP